MAFSPRPSAARRRLVRASRSGASPPRSARCFSSGAALLTQRQVAAAGQPAGVALASPGMFSARPPLPPASSQKAAARAAGCGSQRLQRQRLSRSEPLPLLTPGAFVCAPGTEADASAKERHVSDGHVMTKRATILLYSLRGMKTKTPRISAGGD